MKSLVSMKYVYNNLLGLKVASVLQESFSFSYPGLTFSVKTIYSKYVMAFIEMGLVFHAGGTLEYFLTKDV